MTPRRLVARWGRRAIRTERGVLEATQRQWQQRAERDRRAREVLEAAVQELGCVVGE